MRIAFVADPRSPNGWYRAIGPMVALGMRGHEVRQVLGLGGSFRADLVDGCDVLHVHRQHDERTLALVRRAQQAGTAVVWDNDDDFAVVPKGTADSRRFRGLAGERVQVAVRRLVERAQLVTTPSPLLAERFRALGAGEVRVIENHLRDETLHVRTGQASGASVTVGWLAGREHRLDVERMPIREALGRLLEAHEHVRVVTIGTGLGLDHDRYRHIPRCDFVDLVKPMAEFDVGIAPIADIPFNRARSNVKLKEYAVLGVPWLASPVGPYLGLGEREGGRLVSDDGWFEALERLVTHERERRKLAKRAASWGRKQTIGANAGVWEAALQDALARLSAVDPRSAGGSRCAV